MKTTKIKNILYIPFGLVLGCFLLLASCTDDDYAVDGPMRMFTPNGISVQSLETEVRLTWDASLFTNGISEAYTAQVSADSLFADSAAILLEKTTDTTGIVFTDAELAVREKFFVRIKANSYEERPESNWSESTGFKITGIQLLHPIYNPEILPQEVSVSWDITEGVTHFKLQKYQQSETDPEPILIGDPFEVAITTDEVTTGEKTITGLEPDTKYQIDLYQGQLSVGYRSFKTKTEQVYTILLSPGDDIVTTVNNSVDGDVIALSPGTYDANGENFQIYSKNITIYSTSYNPDDTTILFNEFTLKDTGAGITIKGINLDGQNSALYFINLTSSNGNGDNADFADVVIENCKVHNVATSAFRANRGPNSGYSMNSFNFVYSEFYDFDPSNYGFLHLDELIFNEVNLTNSTFRNTGDLFIRFRQSLNNPNPSATINIEYCTLNSLGNSGNYTLLDAGSVQVIFNFRNSILANIPREGGTSSESLIRLSNETSTANISYNNFFNLTNGDAADPQPVTIPTASYITVQNIFEVDLGWDNNTTNFTLPSGSSLLNASSSGGAIGDPRWWY